MPIPTPFPTPIPDPLAQDLTAPLWDANSWAPAFSALQTVVIMANRYYIVTAFVVLALIALIVWFVARFLAGRQENV